MIQIYTQTAKLDPIPIRSILQQIGILARGNSLWGVSWILTPLMALLPCQECKAQVSNHAIAKPE